MTREECKRAVLGRMERQERGRHAAERADDWRAVLAATLDLLMTRHYPQREAPYKGAVVTDYDFTAADVLELERKLRRGEGA